jgi:hypothetical protein
MRPCVPECIAVFTSESEDKIHTESCTKMLKNGVIFHIGIRIQNVSRKLYKMHQRGRGASPRNPTSKSARKLLPYAPDQCGILYSEMNDKISTESLEAEPCFALGTQVGPWAYSERPWGPWCGGMVRKWRLVLHVIQRHHLPRAQRGDPPSPAPPPSG